MRPLLFTTALASFLLTACASSDTVKIPSGNGTNANGTEPATDAASFCKALCARQGACDQTLDHQTCSNACTNSYAAVFPRLRQDVVSNLLECVAEKDCKTVLGSGLVGTCATEAVTRVAPSNAAVTFCSQMASATQKCGSATSKAACLERAKLYSDGAIAEAQNCTSRKCTEIEACVSAVFGSFGGASSPTPPPKPDDTCGNQSYASLGACRSCAESSCCAEAAACSANSGCLAIVNACNSSSATPSNCSSALEYYGSTSQSLASKFFSCAESKCNGSCSSDEL